SSTDGSPPASCVPPRPSSSSTCARRRRDTSCRCPAARSWSSSGSREARHVHVVLVEPEIPPNTGSIARLCAATATRLHLVGKLGFSLDDRYLKRAGLDYWPFVQLELHADWDEFLAAARPARIAGFSAHGVESYTRRTYSHDDFLVFGGETRGLPDSLRARL